MANRQFHKVMQQFMNDVWKIYCGAHFNLDITDMIERDIRNRLLKIIPEFYQHARIDGKEIHITSVLFKEYSEIIQFFPCMFKVQESYFYDIYIDNVPVGRISFKKILDPCNYGYELTVDPFEQCEFLRDVFITISFEEENLHDEQKPD